MSEKFRRRKSTEERRLRSLLELAPDAMVVADQVGTIVLANAQTENLFGYRKQEVLGHHVEVLIPQRFRERHQRHRINFFSEPQVRPMGAKLQLFALRKDGTEFPVEISLSPVETVEGMLVVSAIRDVSDRKMAEESRLRLAAIVESSEDAIISKTLNGVIVSWNKGAQQIYGYTETEAVGKAITIVVPPELREEENKILERLGAGERIEHYETLRVTKTGRRINISLSLSPIKDSNGRMLGICSISRDISMRKLADEALRTSEARLRLAQQAARIGTFEWNIRTGVNTWTRELEAMYGLPPGGFGGTQTTFENLVHPDDRAGVIALNNAALKSGLPMEGEWRAVWPDGSVHWISGRWQVFMNESGEPSRMIGVNGDVTERKRAEQELSEANERLRLTLEAGSAGGWDYDLKTGKSVWFGTAHAQLGMTPDETSGSGKKFWDRVHEDDRQRLEHALRVAREKHEEYAEDVRVVWRDGTTHWLRSRGRFQYDANGEAERSLGISLDITEQKMAEQRLREYEKAVEGAEDMIGVIDRQYRFLLANRQYLKMRNLPREQVVGHLIPEVLSKEIFETVIKPKLDECFKGEVVKYEMKFSYPALGERDLSLSYFPIEGVSGIDRAVCILHDITERKRAEEALLELNRTLEMQSVLLQSSEKLLKTFVKNVPAAVAMLDRDMRYLQVSDRWCTDYLSGREQVIGHSHYEIFPDMPERWKEVHRRALAGETLRADEDHWVGQDGSRWARWEVRPWETSESDVGGILILTEDITRRKRAEEALAEMTRKLIQAQEQERARIARELHDDISQRLALLAVELEQLRQNPLEVEDRMQELRKQTSEISKDVQALSHDLHSSQLEYLGAVAGIRNWCREFGRRRGMQIDFKHDVQNALPQEIGLCLFRVVQEALHNAARHSGVKRAEVLLEADSDQIHLVVRDSGSGFDVETVKLRKGLGLTSMRERVRLLNGTIEIQSKPMGGTSIHVRVPLALGHEEQRAAG